MAIRVRFMEIQRYDPMIDCEVVRLMGVTDRGTFHSEVRVDGPVTLRLRRQSFKDQVLGEMSIGTTPHEVVL